MEERTSSGELLRAEGLAAGYGPRTVFHDVSFTLAAGTLTALIGPNGSGKTTLLHTICGVHPSWSGEVTVLGAPLRRMRQRDIARRIALVPQFTQMDFAVTVEEAVALGRYPRLGPLAPLGDVDQEAIEDAMRVMDLGDLRARKVTALSGGERQRVILARALAQATRLLILDEPVASLDLGYQQETYIRLQHLARERGAAVLIADHDVNLVSASCRRLLVLHGGRLWADGNPEDIVTSEMIKTVFGARMHVTRTEKGVPQCAWRF